MTFPELMRAFPVQHGDNHAQSLWERLETMHDSPAVETPLPHLVASLDGPETSECPTEEVASFGEEVDHGLTTSQVAIDSQSLCGVSPASPDPRGESLSNIEEISPSAILPSSPQENSVSASLLEDVRFRKGFLNTPNSQRME